MDSLSSYYVKNKQNLIPQKGNIIMGKQYRFSILTPRLIRIEYNAEGKFEDRATSLVVNRNFGEVKYTTTNEDASLMLSTEYFSLTYVKEKPITGNFIRVTVNGTEKEWLPGHNDVRNLGSICYSLDDATDKLKLDKGLYSLDGFVTLDDSKNSVIDNELFLPREQTTDIYLFVYRSDLGLCLQDYFTLTGYPPLIPRYALGAWWYKNDNYNVYDVEEMLKKFNENNIPLSVFMLGNKWHNTINNFTFDPTLFNPTNIKAYFDSKPQKFGLTINPELSINSQDPLYSELIKHMPQQSPTINLIPLNNNTISAYLNIIVNNLLNCGINIFSIDYNNPNDKNDLFLLNHYHYAIANLKQRGIILSRNPGIAPHRYPIIYSGKTRVSWNTLNMLPTYNNSAANLGVSWQAHAIGGYYGGKEDDELYIRYIQFGVFSPIFILASEAGKYYKREPWRWNQLKLSVIRNYIQLRNKLIPYIYSEAYTYHKTGVPIVQPLYYKYPKIYDEPAYVNQYFFGSKIMISPIVKMKNQEMNRVIQRIFIPNGVWYDYSSGKKFIGNKYYMSFYKTEDYPIFIKEGSIIPMSLDNNTNIPINMEIQIYPAENGLFGCYELYEDDGISLNVDKNYMITKMNLDKVESGYKFTITKKNGFMRVPNRNYLLRFKNMKKPDNIIAKYNNLLIDKTFYNEKNDLVISLTNIDVSGTLEIDIIGKNIEIETVNVINEEIKLILDDLGIYTVLKEKIDEIIFSDLPIKKKRIALKKLKREKLEPKFINMFIGLLEFIENK